jgi:superfamily II DNA or RNA helicase
LQFSKENHYNYPDPNPRMERGERYSYDVAFAVFSCKSEGRGIPEPRGASRYTPHPISIPPPNLTLTPAQSKVSEQVNEFLDSPKTQALVWAVTGAGKTEMLVPSVWKVLSAGGKVLWVTP